mmetsp:Transcript_35455/g.72545  ORF Transcript_35455/g.72545 Transcript_35455/m.72545 type:complete len:209 (-) Transcript_35455:179-805(-)
MRAVDLRGRGVGPQDEPNASPGVAGEQRLERLSRSGGGVEEVGGQPREVRGELRRPSLRRREAAGKGGELRVREGGSALRGGPPSKRPRRPRPTQLGPPTPAGCPVDRDEPQIEPGRIQGRRHIRPRSTLFGVGGLLLAPDRRRQIERQARALHPRERRGGFRRVQPVRGRRLVQGRGAGEGGENAAPGESHCAVRRRAVALPEGRRG